MILFTGKVHRHSIVFLSEKHSSSIGCGCDVIDHYSHLMPPLFYFQVQGLHQPKHQRRPVHRDRGGTRDGQVRGLRGPPVQRLLPVIPELPDLQDLGRLRGQGEGGHDSRPAAPDPRAAVQPVVGGRHPAVHGALGARQCPERQ